MSLQYSINTLTSLNLTKIWRGHVLSFVDLKWNDPNVYYNSSVYIIIVYDYFLGYQKATTRY